MLLFCVQSLHAICPKTYLNFFQPLEPSPRKARKTTKTKTVSKGDSTQSKNLKQKEEEAARKKEEEEQQKKEEVARKKQKEEEARKKREEEEARKKREEEEVRKKQEEEERKKKLEEAKKAREEKNKKVIEDNIRIAAVTSVKDAEERRMNRLTNEPETDAEVRLREQLVAAEVLIETTRKITEEKHLQSGDELEVATGPEETGGEEPGDEEDPLNVGMVVDTSGEGGETPTKEKETGKQVYIV